MRFSQPYWLAAGLLVCVALMVLWRGFDARQRAALARFVAPHLRQKLTRSVSPGRVFVQRGLFLAATACLFGALAGPQLGYHWEKISRRGNEVVFAIDTSRSMLTPDVKPNRLARAKLAIDDMARQLEGGIGIVAFAGGAFLVCPLTVDYGAFQQSLDAINVHTIPLGGTNIPAAIQAARGALSRRPGSERILILVTDGENLDGDATAAAREAGMQDGLKIYTVGIGTAAGDLIPLPPDLGGGVVKDETGAVVKSHLDESGLKAIAAATGGNYIHLGEQGEDFEAFLRTVFASVTKHDLLYRQRKIYTERYQWPLAAALVLLSASLLVGTRRYARRPAAALASGASLLLGIALLTTPLRAARADQTATGGAAADGKAPVAQYNIGTSAYRTGHYSQATQAFQKSIETAPASDAKRLADQQDAYYNLGNALYRAGQQVEKSDPRAAVQKWTDAVKAYETALQLRNVDADSRYNRDFVKRRIDALRKPPEDGGGGGSSGGSGADGGSSGGQGSGKPPQGNPPPSGAGSTGAPPPQGAGQAPRPPSGGTPADGDNDPQPTPGQMSAADARRLLDSAKSDEHPSLLVPSGPRAPDSTPDKPFKNW